MVAELSRAQREAVDDIFLSREKDEFDGGTGAGSDSTLLTLEGAEAQGYKVKGFAPTSRAAHKLAEAGMQTSTLQHQPGQRGAARYRREAAVCTRRVFSCLNPPDAQNYATSRSR